MKTFHLISLGCHKNLVDSELMLGNMQQQGWIVVEDPRDASLLLINTCGFIQSAVEESIEEILTLVEYKKEHPEKIIVVAGCLVQRYQKNLVDELSEVDLFIGTESVKDISSLVDRLIKGNNSEKMEIAPRFLMNSKMPRSLSTPTFRSFIKITEGCDNRCSYCMIPSIRGSLRSRSVEDLISEAQHLQTIGVKELTFIAQDLTAYGNDFYGKGNNSPSLVTLLKEVIAKTDIPWLRLLYLYPSGVTDELLGLMHDNSRILPYLDIPFQHVSNNVLAKMNRPYDFDFLNSLIVKIRKYLPEIALRSTFMVGFPGETEEDIIQLEEFLKIAKIDNVGVFSYANESGCPSEKYADQISETEKTDRLQHIVSIQAGISDSIMKKYQGNVETVLVEGLSKETDLLLEGRTRYQAPDVDGCVYITDGQASAGDFVKVKIAETKIYDLVGEIV